MKYTLSNWKYYLQFIVPLRFKTNAHKANKENSGCIWWMWMGNSFNVKFN